MKTPTGRSSNEIAREIVKKCTVGRCCFKLNTLNCADLGLGLDGLPLKRTRERLVFDKHGITIFSFGGTHLSS